MSEFKKNILHFNEVESTNNTARNYLKENRMMSNFVITTDFQYSGRGQSLNTWDSESSKNLLISV